MMTFSCAKATCLWVIVGATLAVQGVGCSSPADAPAQSSDLTAGGSSGTTGTFGGADGGDPAAAAHGCSEEAKLVYVLSLEGDLYSFAPAAKQFTKIGPLACGPTGKYVPISMAVDRNAVAWVNMREATNTTTADGVLFKVDTATAKCTPTKIAGSMGGMGFSTNDTTTTDESLFVVGSDTRSVILTKVDFAAQKLVPGAAFKDTSDMELTGTGDGRLYGFLISSPLAVAAIDKSTSAVSNRVKLSTVETPTSPMFAFSFWGGDFYFYTATDFASTRTTNVTRYRPSDGSIDTSYMRNIGFHIVGAGVSTCAPTTSPN